MVEEKKCYTCDACGAQRIRGHQQAFYYGKVNWTYVSPGGNPPSDVASHLCRTCYTRIIEAIEKTIHVLKREGPFGDE